MEGTVCVRVCELSERVCDVPLWIFYVISVVLQNPFLVYLRFFNYCERINDEQETNH